LQRAIRAIHTHVHAVGSPCTHIHTAHAYI
jgi:hypothetical protein